MFVFICSYLLGCTLFDKEDSIDSSVPIVQDSSTDSAVETDVSWTTPDCPDSMKNIFNQQAESYPNSASEEYSYPSDIVRSAMQSSLQSGLNGQYESAYTSAVTADYTFCQGIGSDAGTLLWYPTELGTGMALIALRASPNGNVILEAPHPKYDMMTGTETMDLFDSLSAQAMIISGTHRCASSEPSGCSGTTSTCGSSQGYSISDPAHNTRSIFHLVHEEISEHHSEDIVISVHGMSGDGISVSNGTKFDVAEDSLVARLSEDLKFRMGEENTTTCNSYSTANVHERLCGTTNTQGRHLNRSTEPCSVAATSASERFLHIEQSRELRENPSHLISALQTVLR